ncbi:UDP-N-acetylmuramate dehydrogenase [Campylobacter suis]|uniref:UDP-N-acetylenolpyruvoylglucosamine reductase n=1 Tax=Campylobacter suis TaxID=2790657 RepID=A0ABM8Q9H1_9BACT|nr:UDP-N-acetylmuramate dehydrogenase [Campylobacter suis]CAD7289414.1 UDP-N-acetylenolpyruvoylglucosamine reductase [Campylobacter suis]
MTQLINFAKYSSVRIGGEHEVLVLNEPCKLEQGTRMIGGANNLLVSATPPKMAILSEKFNYINLQDNCLEIGAATKSGAIYNFAKKHDISGFEFVKSIPGTLGGMVFMNAGLLGLSISDLLTDVLLYRGWVPKSEINFSYRHSGICEPIFGARFEIARGFDIKFADEISAKRANQPRGASFGSCFANPAGDFAGRLIEAVGLKGYIVGGAKFSEQHANFLINFNNATFDDATTLIALAQKRVFESFGIELKTEVIVL